MPSMHEVLGLIPGTRGWGSKEWRVSCYGQEKRNSITLLCIPLGHHWNPLPAGNFGNRKSNFLFLRKKSLDRIG